MYVNLKDYIFENEYVFCVILIRVVIEWFFFVYKESDFCFLFCLINVNWKFVKDVDFFVEIKEGFERGNYKYLCYLCLCEKKKYLDRKSVV